MWTPPPYVYLASTRHYSRDRCSQAFPVFRALLPPCIILNANRRTKNGVGLGMRLCFLIVGLVRSSLRFVPSLIPRLSPPPAFRGESLGTRLCFLIVGLVRSSLRFVPSLIPRLSPSPAFRGESLGTRLEEALVPYVHLASTRLKL